MKQTDKKTKPAGSLPWADYFTLYNQLMDSKLGKRLNLRKLSEQVVYLGAKNGVRAAGATSRIFKSIQPGNAQRPSSKKTSDLFDLNYDEEQTMIQDTLLKFATKMRAAAEKIDADKAISEEIQAEYNEMQLAFMQTPESLGGMTQERSTVTQMMMVESLAYGDLGQAFALFSGNSVLNAVIQWGTESQQEELVPLFLKEQPETAAIAINEPSALFSPFELNTTATTEGDDFIINGVKNMVPLAEHVSFFLVAATTEHHGIQLFIIDKETTGVEITRDKYMGLNAAQMCEIKFDAVKVHASAMLGGSAGIPYDTFISYSKLGWCALSVGCCQAVLDYVITYANDRYAFGEPISNRQAVAFMIADMKIELESMRILTQRAAAKAEQGLDFKRDAYLAHVLCSDKSMQIGSNGVQLLGGHGYIKDFPVERWYRDLRAVAITANGLHI